MGMFQDPLAEDLRKKLQDLQGNKVERTVLDEAHELVGGDRAKHYGDSLGNHETVAALWTTYLRRRGLLAGADGGVTAEDVCLLNVLQKVARHAHLPKRDNIVDICGWARNAEIVAGESWEV